MNHDGSGWLQLPGEPGRSQDAIKAPKSAMSRQETLPATVRSLRVMVVDTAHDGPRFTYPQHDMH